MESLYENHSAMCDIGESCFFASAGLNKIKFL